MDRQEARDHITDAHAMAPSCGQGPLVSTFTIRHRKELDVAFVLDGKPGDFQIGMGAASGAYTSVLSLGVDRLGDRLHATGTWTHDGRVTRLPVTVLHRTPSVIVLEAGGLPLADRPQSLKCWSFLRQLGTDHYSKVKGFVSPDLEALPPVTLRTYPGQRR